MREDPELFVPASEAPPRASGWWQVVANLYWVLGAFAMALALYMGLSGLQPGHFRDALMPLAITTLAWLGFGRIVGWIMRPVLSPRRDSR